MLGGYGELYGLENAFEVGFLHGFRDHEAPVACKIGG
jgi:hypothetical protein